MTSDIDLSIREIDDLLQHLYLKLRGKKEGLSLAEPAAILLARLKSVNPSFYAPQLTRFTPIIMDTLISGAYISFGYEGLLSLNEVTGDIELATGDYIPAGVEEGLSSIRDEIESISAILGGNSPITGAMADIGGESETGTGGFFRESAWGTVGLPLVSTYNTGKTPFSTGRVVKARVEIRITGEWSIRIKHDPVITFDHISAEPNSVFEQQIRTAVKVAENYATTAMGMKGILRIPREYRISLPEIASFPASAIQRLSGGSAGLAISTLLISVLSNLDLHSKRMHVGPDKSFTGVVNKRGDILAVDDSHVADKIRAVFFSNTSNLILPEENLETAEMELTTLKKGYPARRLDLIPVKDISEVIDDSGVALKTRVPAGKPILQRMFLWRKHLFAAGSTLALALILSLIALPYARRDIAKINYQGTRILIYNQFGRLITEHMLDFPIPDGYSTRYRIFISDFDGNGEKEALCVISDSRHHNPSSQYNRLHFISFDNEGRFRYKYTFDIEKILGDQMSKDGYHFPVDIAKASRIFRDSSGENRFLAILHHASRKPGTVINISLENFTKNIFLHKGFLFNMVMKDIDRDGIEDIVLSGYNNALKSCVVLVLDQDHMNGSSPGDANYHLDGFEDIAKYYLRFPDFYRYRPLPGSDWLPMNTKIKNSQDGLIATVTNRGNNASFFLADNMECVRAEVFDIAKAKGDSIKMALVDYSAEQKAHDELMLRDGVRYWDGEDWVSEPTVNKAYLDHSGHSIDRRIAQVDHENTTLLLKNKRGITIATHDIGFRTSKIGSYRKIFFGDFLEDDGSEILCALCNSRFMSDNDPDFNKLFIFIFSEDGILLRRHVYDEASIIGSELERLSRRTSMQMMLTSSTFSEQFGQGFMFAGTHHKTEQPVALIRFSLDDGSQEAFFHKGYINKLFSRDVDGDGRNELLMTGYNNLLENMVVIVLDPDHIGGASPRGACYNISDNNVDIAKYYIRLPKYHRFVEFPSRYYPLHPNIIDDSGELRLIVKSRTEAVVYTIAEGMSFINAEVFMTHKSSSGQRDSLSSVEFTETEKEEDEKGLLEGVRFWDGENWVAEPVVNRSYLKHVREGD